MVKGRSVRIESIVTSLAVRAKGQDVILGKDQVYT